MNGQNKPNARKKRVVGAGKGIEKKGEGLGIGPVGQMNKTPGQSAFEHIAKDAVKDAAAHVAKEAVHHAAQKAQGGAQGTRPSASRPATGGFFGQASQGASRPSASRPATGSTRPSTSRTGGTQHSGQSRRGGVPAGMGRGGCSGKLLLIVVAVIAFFVLGGKNLLFGGNDNNANNNVTNLTTTTSQSSNQTSSQNSGSGSTQSSGSGSGTSSTESSGSGSGTSSGSGSTANSGSGSSGSIMNLLSSFLGSTDSNTAYDFGGTLNGLTGGSGDSDSAGTSGSSGTSGNGGYSQYFTTTLENNTAQANTSVASGARNKYTTIKGKNKDTMTILVYMCGADLESENGMASSDLKEMVNANLSDNVNLIVYTGGARKWRNSVVSAKVNQIYRIKKGGMERLVENDGKDSMTNPKTLARFIQYGAKNYPANRMALIFWDHGGGSVSGYGYDERYSQGQTMTLAGINEALANGGVKFDFIGFDTCLMSTVENGLMLESYADYMIASEESEPGVGWYYTNWLNKVSKNTSMSTVEIGKTIVDDFVEVCNRQCRGQATTLSVTDLAELGATVPKELREFSIETNELIQNKEYKKVAQARSRTQEFATHAKIDQIDLIHFAKNLGTAEASDLAKALQGAIKYNRTGGGISNAYGLSIYFPYKQAGTVNKAVATYQAIGMEDEYVRCIQEFASLEVSGQLGGGSSLVSFGSGSGLSGLFGGYGSGGSSSGSSSGGLGGSALSGLLESLGGGSGSSYSSIGSGYSGGGLESLLGGYYGGGSSSGGTGSILDLFIGRSLTAKTAAVYIQENHFDPSVLQWENGRISFTDEQLSNLVDIQKNMFFDDGEGYINMGFDTQIETQGNDLIYEFDGTWLSVDRQPVAYYRIGTVEQDTCYAEVGYVPAIVNGTRADLILVFDQDNPYGYIAGAMTVYLNGETDTEAKNLVGIGKGDQIQFVCDYLDYKGNYQDTYKLGDPITLGDEIEIGNTYVDAKKCKLTYCLTDIYQGHYWTPVM